MHLSNFRYFMDVVEMGTISQAARKNFMTQQALSDRIRRLEKRCGMPLLERTNPVRLTPAGECVCRTAREILEKMERLEQELGALNAKRENRLIISTGMTATPPFMPELMTKFYERMPEVELLLIHPGSLEAELAGIPPEADLLIGNLPFGEDVEAIEMFRDPVCIAVSEKKLEHRYGVDWKRREGEFLGRKTVREWSEIELGTARCNGREITDGLQRNEGVSAYSMELLQHLCQTGQCAAVVPTHFARTVFRDVPQMRIYSLCGEDLLFRVAIGVRRGRPRTAAVEGFIQTAQELFRSEAE